MRVARTLVRLVELDPAGERIPAASVSRLSSTTSAPRTAAAARRPANDRPPPRWCPRRAPAGRRSRSGRSGQRRTPAHCPSGRAGLGDRPQRHRQRLDPRAVFDVHASGMANNCEWCTAAYSANAPGAFRPRLGRVAAQDQQVLLTPRAGPAAAQRHHRYGLADVPAVRFCPSAATVAENSWPGIPQVGSRPRCASPSRRSHTSGSPAPLRRAAPQGRAAQRAQRPQECGPAPSSLTELSQLRAIRETVGL